MKVIIWLLTISVLIYWLPRLFLNHIWPLFLDCSPIEVLPGIYKVNGPRSDVKNVYIVTNGPVTIIDPGLFYSTNCIKKCLKKLDLNFKDVRFIVATHYHIDHAGNIGNLRKKSGAVVIAHLKDKPYIEGQLMDHYKNAPWYLKIALAFVEFLFFDYTSKVDLCVDEGQHLEIYGGVDVICSPGHTPGSISLYSSNLKILFSGDAIQSFDSRVRRAKEIYSDDLQEDVKTIRRLSQLDFVHLLPGDGQPVLNDAKTRVLKYVETLK